MFQSTPSGGKATAKCTEKGWEIIVSIHAFRGEGDVSRRGLWLSISGFNPRLPGGRRRLASLITTSEGQFQSTPSGGKATRMGLPYPAPHERFNPRLPGGRRLRRALARPRLSRFQSTPSGGKATRRAVITQGYGVGFNPRLPGGRRRDGESGCLYHESFNPRLPGGRRPCRSVDAQCSVAFQSTPSGGKATTSGTE